MRMDVVINKHVFIRDIVTELHNTITISYNTHIRTTRKHLKCFKAFNKFRTLKRQKSKPLLSIDQQHVYILLQGALFSTVFIESHFSHTSSLPTCSQIIKPKCQE